MYKGGEDGSVASELKFNILTPEQVKDFSIYWHFTSPHFCQIL
jgi:hypothetical protein